MDWKPYMTVDPEIMHGAVCFKGTREYGVRPIPYTH